jgi:hypothetical protein
MFRRVYDAESHASCELIDTTAAAVEALSWALDVLGDALAHLVRTRPAERP